MDAASRRWAPVWLWVAGIYTTIPFVRGLREWYVARWDPTWIGVAVAAVLISVAALILVVLRRRTGTLSPGNIAWIICITGVFVVWTLSLRQSPEEAVHFLEYGVLAILLHRALRPTMRCDLVFIAAALIGGLVGTVDEIIQWISPNRFWDWRDLVLNAGAGALAQLVLWRVVSPSAKRWDPRSGQIVLRLAVVQLLLLTLCLANTPERVARYAPYFPGSGHLISTRNPMAEYGHRFVVPGLGIFRSRLTLEKLRQQDHTRAEEVADLIDENRNRYGQFLDTWPVSEDPFTYETRVHLYARDRNHAKARTRDFEGSMAREQLTTAWNENRLLETFFGNTLGHSAYPWRPQLRKRIESSHDPDLRFQSAAGSHLITIASERTLCLALVVLAAAMLVADRWIGRSLGGSHES